MFRQKASFQTLKRAMQNRLTSSFSSFHADRLIKPTKRALASLLIFSLLAPSAIQAMDEVVELPNGKNGIHSKLSEEVKGLLPKPSKPLDVEAKEGIPASGNSSDLSHPSGSESGGSSPEKALLNSTSLIKPIANGFLEARNEVEGLDFEGHESGSSPERLSPERLSPRVEEDVQVEQLRREEEEAKRKRLEEEEHLRLEEARRERKEKKKDLPIKERKRVHAHPLLLDSDEEEIVPAHSHKKKSSDLKHEPYEKPIVVPIHISPEDFKKAWEGNGRLQTLIRGWVNNLENTDPQVAAEVIRALRAYARNHAPHTNTSLKDMNHWAIISNPEDEEETIDTRRLLDLSINEDQLERGLGRGKDLPPVNLPEGWDLNTNHSKKILKFLRHLEHYTFQNETTWKQWAGMALFAVLGGLAAWPDVPVFTVGFIDIFDLRLNLNPDEDGPAFQNTLVSYVLTTALLDNVPRMAWCARRFLAPSTQEFSVSFNKVKNYGLLALVAGGALVPTVVQLFYLVDAETTFMKWAKEEGDDPSSFKRYLYIWAPFYTIEAGIWSLDQLNNFKNWVHRRFFRDKISDMFPYEISHFRKGLLENLEGLEKAFYWMPDEQIRQIYDQVFDPNLLSDMKMQAPNGNKDQWDCMMGFCRLRYLVNMAGDLQEDFVAVHSGYKTFTEWLSMGSACVASAARLLGLQIVFQLLFQELSGGLISPASSEVIGWVCSAAFGLLAQGGAEVIGNVDFFHDFLRNTETQGETALRGLRYPAKVYTAFESVWNLIPLTALCLDGTDKFFGGNYYWMFLFSPYILNEFFGGAVTLAESYVKNIPTTINRGYNRARRLCGFQNTTGYMRDELVLMVGRMKDLLTEADLDVLMFIQNNVVDQRELEHRSSSSEGMTTSPSTTLTNTSPSYTDSSSPEGSPKGNGKLNGFHADEEEF